ncbi:Fc receptor-like protein 3 isoform X1 [Macrotis lagotis]|uniref:Fc receptor-like protein 3 isoform X1 n=1 Tax=Macrotis lagotis TaxID=92651 RepID=UPI003D69D2E7
MLLWVSLLVVASACGQSALKPMISIIPPWTTHFKGKSVILTCKGFRSYVTWKTQWYFNNKLLKENLSHIKVETSGKYQCRTEDSPLSNPVSLSFLSDELILQTPYPAFEGDSLILRCLGKKETEFTQVTYYKNEINLKSFQKYSDFFIPRAKLIDSGWYCCSARSLMYSFIPREIKSERESIQIQELFSPPILRSTTFEPLEGTPMTLRCETQLPSEKANTQLHFSFFRNDRIILSSQKSASVLYLTNVWKEDSGSYFCEAKAVTSGVWKKSSPVSINVRRIPVSGILLEIQPPGGQVTEGQVLILLCSVTRGTGDITFTWHKEGTGKILKKKIQTSLVAEFKILTVIETDTGRYYCTADNTNSQLYSKLVSISVKIPVSPPLLTFNVPETQMFVGKVVVLQCDVQRGSAPILYQFYHDGKIMKNSSAPFGGAAFFNLSLTEQHAGNYFCKADNGISVQSSKVLRVSVKVPVSRPLLTITVPKRQATAGDVVELQCEAETGTTPILYKFFLQSTILGSAWVHLRGAAFLNLNLTAEDSGIYSCEADNGFSSQISEGVKLSVTVSTGKQRGLVAGGVSLSLLIFLGLLGVALLLYFRTQRRSGESFALGFSRDPAIPRSQEPIQMELEPTYVNDLGQMSRTHHPVFAEPELAVNPVIRDIMYSEVEMLQQKKEDADDFASNYLASMLPSSQDFSIVYTEVKAQSPLEERVSVTEVTDKTQEDDTGNYENI